jgi:hypothetical protein
MKNKATHNGHCQVCGSGQKLPGGVLSKHGYTRRWGFFDGVCSGAGYLPFEQDISLIEGMIAWAEKDAARLREQAARERTENDPENCWYHAYIGDRKGYQWVRTRLYMEEQVLPYGTFSTMKMEHPGNYRNPNKHGERVHGGLPYKDLAGAAQQCNNDHANYLEKEAVRRDEYAAWQRGRIKDWAPSELTPVG